MSSDIQFVFDGRLARLNLGASPDLGPTTTVLRYLRSLPLSRGVKEGCAEGDCGACSVVLGELEGGRIRYRAVDSCLVFLPMLHGRQLITIEDLCARNPGFGDLHPVQKSMVECNGAQCGYCTPGIVMSLFALYKRGHRPGRAEIDDCLTGNLCRCTGYRSIVESAVASCQGDTTDRFSADEERIARLLAQIDSEEREISIDNGRQLYMRPRTLEEACRLKELHPGAIVISGATDVALRVTKKHELLEQILDLGAITELRGCAKRDGALFIGAGLDLNAVMNACSADFPALSSMLAVFGSSQIRNMATLGGNLGTASPIGDTLPVLIAYGANVVLASSEGGRRSVPMNGFITGYRETLRRPEELIAGVELPLPSSRLVRSYKVSKRRDMDISTVSAGFAIELDQDRAVRDICLAYGGMAARVLRAGRAESFLRGKAWSRENVEQAMEIVRSEFTPISDARSGAELRSVASKNLLLKFWSETGGAGAGS